MNKKRFFQNAIMLIIITFLLRLVWTAFRVVVSNRVGAECMGLYQLTFAIYNISVTFATSGINFAATRLVTQAISSQKMSARAVMHKCIAYSLLFGLAALLVIFSLAQPIGVHLLCDDRTILSLKAFAISLPFISVSSAVSGYFYAVRNVGITLFSRGFEQAVQIAAFFALMMLVPKGNLELSCLAIVISAAISEVFSSIFLFLAYVLIAKKHKGSGDSKIWRKICSIALPSAAGAYLKSGLQTVESVLIPLGFRKYGASKGAALEGYGMLCSMVMPVLFFPSFVLSSFSMLFIPEFTEAQTLCREREIQKTSQFAIKLTLMFALFVSANFICFGRELGELLYSSSRAGALIEIMAPIIPFMYLDSIADGMLKGLGEYNRVLAYSSIDTVVSIAMIYFIVPKAGLYGYIAVVYVSTMLNSFLSIRRLLVLSKNRIEFFGDIVFPFAIALTSALFSKSFGNFLFPAQQDALSLTVLMFVSVTALCIMILVSRGNIYKTFKAAFSILLPQSPKRHFSGKRCIKIP
ncbi:MAG: oligosaccharide flippase family protein [Oscillospiraceae bacterium]|nr:oligosaccharide flippase family protein [Oscillospiraceae bacterium]